MLPSQLKLALVPVGMAAFAASWIVNLRIALPQWLPREETHQRGRSTQQQIDGHLRCLGLGMHAFQALYHITGPDDVGPCRRQLLELRDQKGRIFELQGPTSRGLLCAATQC